MFTRRLLIVLAVATVILGCLALLVNGHRMPERVYSVADVDTAIAGDPGAWIGRTVLVRGELTVAPCVFSGYCRAYHLAIMEADQVPSSSSYVDHASAPDMQRVLLLAVEPRNTFAARLHGVPLLGALIPGPQRLHWQRPATYRVRLAAVPSSQCAAPRCFGAVLVGGAGPYVQD